MKALIIEPSKSYFEMLHSIFESLHFETVHFVSGETGLDGFDQESFDLVCVSLHLPDMTGIDFTKKLRSKKECILPVIMLTSEEDKTVLSEGIKAGITEIFNKNNLDDLNNYLTDYLEKEASDRKLDGHILYVEDNIAVAEMIKYHLSLMGFEVSHFTTGEAAFQEFTENEYDLVMTDILLEGSMSGLGLIRGIRRFSGKKKRIPILAVSGLDDVSRKIEILRSGATDYISKPVIEEELSARVKNLITNKLLLDQVESQQKRLQDLAMKDPLTGLFNRNCLSEMAPKLISEARRHGFPLSLLFIDLDHFKLVNDTHGHDVGDIVLVQTASLLIAACREGDIAARFGGEEFILILPHCSGSDAVKKAEKLRQEIEDLNPHDIRTTASFGVSSLPSEKKQSVVFESLCKAADQAVYVAKEKGRNCVVLKEIVC